MRIRILLSFHKFWSMILLFILLLTPFIITIGCGNNVNDFIGGGEPDNSILNIHYVDINSPIADDSGEGTILNPWKSIQYGMNNVVPGDTLMIREGNYREAVTTVRDGKNNAVITIRAYPGETVNIDRFWISHSNYRLKGFNIRGTKYASIYLEPGISNIEIIGNNINVAGSDNISAINCPGGEDSQLTSNLIIKNNTFGPSKEAGIFCVRLRGTGHLIENNNFNYWNGRDAICMAARNTKIIGNIFNSISHQEDAATHPDCIQIYVENNSSQANVLVEGNIFKNCSGQIIRMYQNSIENQTCPDWSIKNNYFLNSGAKALQARGDHCLIYNNLFFLTTVNTAHPLGFLKDNTNSEALSNIFVGCGSDPEADNQGWWNEAADTSIWHRDNYVTTSPPEYLCRDKFNEGTGICGGDPLFKNVPIGWVWANANGGLYKGSQDSFEINSSQIDMFKVGDFIEYSPFITGADGIARRIVSISGILLNLHLKY